MNTESVARPPAMQQIANDVELRLLMLDLALADVAEALLRYRQVETGADVSPLTDQTAPMQARFMLLALRAIDAMDPDIATQDMQTVLAELEDGPGEHKPDPLAFAREALSRYQARQAIPTVRRMPVPPQPVFLERCHGCGQGEVVLDDQDGTIACTSCGRDYSHIPDLQIKAQRVRR